MRIGNVLWLGGGCGAGKTTLARLIAYRYDLRLYRVDSFAYPHQARRDRLRHPVMERFAHSSFTRRFVEPSVGEMVSDFLAISRERFEMIRDDLTARSHGRLVIAEGPSLLPELVASVAASKSHTMWLLPTPEFTNRSRRARDESRLAAGSQAERAQRNLVARDARLTEIIRDQSAAHALPARDVDGSCDVEDSVLRLTEHFHSVISAGPRAAVGAERAALRRAENAETYTAVTAFRDSLGEAPAELPPVTFACECATLGVISKCLYPQRSTGKGRKCARIRVLCLPGKASRHDSSFFGGWPKA